MIDYARITVKAGNGGHGAGSFFHIKGKRYGKADGGDGGRGGNVLIETTRDLNALEPFRYIKDYKAKNGGNGLSNHCRGADGEDLVIKVPVGTIVKVDSQSVKSEKKLFTSHFDFDLIKDCQRILIARGGEGGRGNAKLRDEYGRRPRVGEAGEEGEGSNLTLELKLIADVGIIGLPNAGKSTLLSKLTAATPKIADYPFTTLEPNLGVLQVESQSRKSKSQSQKESELSTSHFDFDFDSLVLADIPGLIEGASKGKGLGDLFLRHIERTKMLVHLIDVSKGITSITGITSHEANTSEAGFDSSEVRGSREEILWQNYQTIIKELKAYSGELAKKKEIVVLNKIDQSDRQVIQDARQEFAKHRKKVVAISAKEGTGLTELVDLLLKIARKK